MKTQKKEFVVQEVQFGVVMFSTRIFAANEKSLLLTSLMRKILLNKNTESVLMISEV